MKTEIKEINPMKGKMPKVCQGVRPNMFPDSALLEITRKSEDHRGKPFFSLFS